MKILSSIQKAIEIDVEPPFFRKERNPHSSFVAYAALIDENTFIRMSRLKDEYLQVSLQSSDACKSEIVNTFTTWETIEESEFMEAYNSMLEGFSLTPKLVHVSAANADDLKDLNI